jgi:hypothetical protein
LLSRQRRYIGWRRGYRHARFKPMSAAHERLFTISNDHRRTGQELRQRVQHEPGLCGPYPRY